MSFMWKACIKNYKMKINKTKLLIRLSLKNIKYSH